MNKLQDGPGTTKNVANHDEVRRARKAAQKKSSSASRIITAADQIRLQQEATRKEAAENTINALTLKLLSKPEVLKVAEFMLDVYATSKPRHVDGKLLKPIDVALTRAHQKYSREYRPGVINVANVAVRQELAYQLNQL